MKACVAIVSECDPSPCVGVPLAPAWKRRQNILVPHPRHSGGLIMDGEYAVDAVFGIDVTRSTLLSDDYNLLMTPLSRRYHTRRRPIPVGAGGDRIIQIWVFAARDNSVQAIFATDSNIDCILAPVHTVNFEQFASFRAITPLKCGAHFSQGAVAIHSRVCPHKWLLRRMLLRIGAGLNCHSALVTPENYRNL
mgnify:CR=1 FL=1